MCYFLTPVLSVKSTRKSVPSVRSLERIKKQNPNLVIGVGGCVASQEGEHIRHRAPYVDIVFGPQTLHRLPEMINQIRGGKSSVVDVSFLRLRNLTVYRNLVQKVQPRLCLLWKAVINIVLTAWCLIPVVKK